MADLLPRVEIQVNLYNTPSMQQAAHKLYGLVLQHCYSMLEWYEEGRLTHAWKAFIKPYSLRFEDTVKEVESASRLIEQLANVELQREQRQVYKMLQVLLAKHVASERNQQAITTLVQDSIAVVGELRAKLDAHKTISTGAFTTISSRVEDLLAKVDTHQSTNAGSFFAIRESTKDLQIAKMVSLTFTDGFAAPCDALRRRIAVARRQQKQQDWQLDAVWKAAALNSWSTAPESRILHVISARASRDRTRALSAYMAALIQSSDFVVLWAIRPVGEAANAGYTPTQVLKYLTMQAIKATAKANQAHISEDFNATRVATAATEEQWFQLFFQTVSSVQIVYVIVDLDLFGISDEVSAWLSLWSMRIRDSKPTVKLCLFGSTAQQLRRRSSPSDLLLDIGKETSSRNTPRVAAAQASSRRSGLQTRGALAFRNRLRSSCS